MKGKIFTLFLAGSVFCCGCASGGKVKSGVTFDGSELGGLTFSEAAARVRGKLEAYYAPLVIRTPAGDFSAQLDYSDDVDRVLRAAKRGESLTFKVSRNWADAEAELEKICAANARDPENAAVEFSADGFSYTAEKCGVACDYAKLLGDTVRALSSGGEEVTLTTYPVLPEVTEELLRERTQEIGTFSTAFDAGNAPRSHNIALAAERITGTILEAGEVFSFNETVGSRTKENGFEEAAVIYDGEFVQGVGGGVCQVSTTLFGAALRAGMLPVESHPHSLAIGYVGPSQDAMVSSQSDLRFQNPYKEPVYLRAEVKGGRVTFTFYGLPTGLFYEVESVVERRVPPPPAKVVEGSKDRTVRAAREGLISESYLIVKDGSGNPIKRTLIRRDVYNFVQGIVERAPVTEEKILEEESEN